MLDITLQYATVTTTNATTTALHFTTLRYSNYITLHYNWNYHYIALHDTTLKLQLHYFTLQYARLRYTIPRYSTQHYSTINYSTLVTPHHNYNCNCNYYTTSQLLYNTTTTYNYNSTTLQLQLHLQLHYTTLHPAVVVRWPLQPLQPFQKTQLQPPFGPSVDSFCHPWVTTTNPSYRFPIFETSVAALCGTTGISKVISHCLQFSSNTASENTSSTFMWAGKYPTRKYPSKPTTYTDGLYTNNKFKIAIASR